MIGSYFKIKLLGRVFPPILKETNFTLPVSPTYLLESIFTSNPVEEQHMTKIVPSRGHVTCYIDAINPF